MVKNYQNYRLSNIVANDGHMLRWLLEANNNQIMTELNKEQELWQTTTPGMEYDHVLSAAFSHRDLCFKATKYLRNKGIQPLPDVSVRYYCCSDCNAKFDTKTWKPYWLKNAKHTTGNTSKICKGNYREVNEQEFNAH